MTFGLVKHNNNSISAITSAGQLAQGKMTLIKEQTASSSSSISFVDGSSDVVLDSTYPIYLFKFINMHPATDNVDFLVNFSADGGSNYNVTKTTTFFAAYQNESGSATSLTYADANDLSQSTDFQMLNDGVGNGNDESCAGILKVFEPSSSTFIKHFLGRAHGYTHNNYAINEFAAGYINTTTAITRIRFKFASGNIDAGTFRLYGLKK